MEPSAKEKRASRNAGDEAIACGARSSMSVAIGTPTRPWGVLVVATVNVRNFTDDDVVFLQALSNVLGAALS